MGFGTFSARHEPGILAQKSTCLWRNSNFYWMQVILDHDMLQIVLKGKAPMENELLELRTSLIATNLMVRC